MAASSSSWKFLIKGAFWVPVGITINSLFVSFASVKGRSMQPALNDGLRGNEVRDCVLLDKFSIQIRQRYTRGDIVVLRSPEEPETLLIKRLIAIEGDWITDRNGKAVIVPKGRCWVEGDNADFSDADSSKYGPIPLALIDSRVIAILWPLSEMKLCQRQVPHKRVNGAEQVTI